MLSDWVEAKYVHYQGDMKLQDLLRFLGSVQVRSVMLHKILDTDKDSRVEFEVIHAYLCVLTFERFSALRMSLKTLLPHVRT